MRYRVKIIKVQPPGPESDAGLPASIWPDAFNTIEKAVEHAEESLREKGQPPGTYMYDVVDDNGNSVLHLICRKQ